MSKQFTEAVVQMLIDSGYHVSSLEDAYYCLRGIVSNATIDEIKRDMEAKQWHYKTSSGLKNTDQEN